MSSEIPAGNGVTSNEFTIDQIISQHFDDPVFEQESYKGLDARTIIESLPEDGKKLVQNLRSDYTRKTTELAKQKKSLEEREATILTTNVQALRERMNIPDDIDIYSPDGLQKYVQAKVASALHEQQAPLIERFNEEKRRDELLKFKSEHPDMDSLKAEIIETMGSDGLDIKAAYWVAKGKAAEKDSASAAVAQREAKKEQRQAGMKVGVGAPVNVKSNAPKTAREAYDIMKSKGLA